MGEVMIERFSNPRGDSLLPRTERVGCWGGAKRSAIDPREITVTVGVRTYSGAERTVEVGLDERQATKLIGELVEAVGFSSRVRNALMLEAYNARYLMPALLDGLQDAGIDGLEEG